MNDTETILLKRKLKEISKYKGQGTQLISLYLPPDADRSSVTKQLTDEISQSSNIKSAQTRKNVQSALRRITNYLKQIDFKLPNTGLVLFSGEISTNPSKSDIILLPIIPPKRLTIKLYWCDSSFHLPPLEKMVESDEVYGIIAVDKREATIALLKGKVQEIIGHETSGVPGKTRAGGQCLKNAQIQLSNGNIVSIEDLNKTNVISADFKKHNLKNSIITRKWIVNKNKTYKLITKLPRLEIECSEDHTFFLNTDKGIVAKQTKDIKESDYLIMPEKINIKGKLQKFNSKKYYNAFEINKEGQKILKEKRQLKKLYQKDLASKIGITQTAISTLELGKRNSRRDILEKICTQLSINYSYFLKKYTKKVVYRDIKLPNELNKDFAQFIGYLIGDGSIEIDKVTFFEQSKQVALNYKLKFDKLFKLKSTYRFIVSKNYYKLKFTNIPLVRLVKEEFPEIKKTQNSKVPKKILLSENNVVSSFLKGFYDAKGFVTKSKIIRLRINNKIIAQQIQMLLLRFSIISSINIYSNKQNSYSNNIRYYVDITEKKSIELFKKYIGFTCIEKSKKLNFVIKNKSNTSHSRQILLSGKEIRKIIEEKGFNLEQYPKVSNFFNNKRMISKDIFKKSIINYTKDKTLKSKLEKIYNYSILPVKINKIDIIKEKTKMIDISVKNKNFLANSLIVHNSAHRFERLREKAAESFYKRIGEKINAIFMNLENFKGIIIGGPGNTKKEFIEKADVDNQILDKLLGTVDTSYTDESGIKEILDKSSEILKEVGIIKERELVNNFIKQVATNNYGTYGYKEVINVLNLGQAQTILLSEAINWSILKFKCINQSKIFTRLVKDKSQIQNIISEYEGKSKECSSSAELIEEIDLFDFFVEIAKLTSADVILVSTDTSEGKQFYETFGGIGAILRYK